MALIVEPLDGAENTKYVSHWGWGGLHLDPKSLTIHLCDDWDLDAKEILEVSKYPLFAGMRKGKKASVFNGQVA